jgi:DNA-binding transcriptional ArsR family regulator
MDAALKALADPTRRRILELVRDAERPAGEIAEHFAVTRTAVSQHLTVLRGAGLLAERRDRTRRLYRARPEGLAELRSYLDQFWGSALLSLKAAVEADIDRSGEPRRSATGRGATRGDRR